MICVRSATIADAPAVQAIYAPYVKQTAVTFELEPPDIAEIARRIETATRQHRFLVATDNGDIIGYAYTSAHRTRAAYRTSVDVAIYVRQGDHGRGIGRGLYEQLLSDALAQGYHAAFAGIALPNAASIHLHEAMGFSPVGTYREVGWKLGQWHDVGWWQRLLQG